MNNFWTLLYLCPNNFELYDKSNNYESYDTITSAIKNQNASGVVEVNRKVAGHCGIFRMAHRPSGYSI